MASKVCVDGLVERQSGGAVGKGRIAHLHTSVCLFFPSGRSFVYLHPCLMLLACLFFGAKLLQPPSRHSPTPPNTSSSQNPTPFPSIRLLFLGLCVLRKKLIMFLISWVFQSPSKRDERETGRRETEVVVVGVCDEQVLRRDEGRN